MQYTKSTELYTDEAKGSRLQSIFLIVKLTDVTVFNVLKGDILSCFNKINKKPQKNRQI